MKWMRRIHLYAGLLLLPWIVLYATTACMFNHPHWFRSNSPNETTVTTQITLATTNPAAKLAEEVVASIRKHAEQNGSNGPRIRLITPEKATYSRPMSAQAVLADGRIFSVSVNFGDGKGTARPRLNNAQTNAVPDFARGRHVLASAPLEQGKKSLIEAMRQAGFHTQEIEVQTVPEVEFQLEVDDQPWAVKYHLHRGTLAARTRNASASFSVPNFLRSLHTSHEYPDTVGPRWFWAVMMDAMVLSLIFWGVSGLLMWWQLKGQRRIGFILLLVSAGWATWLALGMHQAMSR